MFLRGFWAECEAEAKPRIPSVHEQVAIIVPGALFGAILSYQIQATR